MTSFKASQEAAWRRFLREAVKNSSLSKSERDVTLALLNMWLHHRNGPKGHIHPGRKKLAKAADVSIRTVATTLAKLREAGVLNVVGRAHGEGQKPTQYRLKTRALIVYCCADLPEWMEGDLAPVQDKVACKIAHHWNPELHTTGVQKLHTVLTDVSTHPSQTLKVVGGRNA